MSGRWFSSSSAFQPTPTPNSTRPPDSRSSVADRLGQVEHVVLEHEAHAEAELQPLGRRGRHRQADERVHHAAVLVGHLAARRVGRASRGRDVRVLADEQRRVPAVFELAGEHVGADVLRRVHGREAEFHVDAPVQRGSSRQAEVALAEDVLHHFGGAAGDRRGAAGEQRVRRRRGRARRSQSTPARSKRTSARLLVESARTYCLISDAAAPAASASLMLASARSPIHCRIRAAM